MDLGFRGVDTHIKTTRPRENEENSLSSFTAAALLDALLPTPVFSDSLKKKLPPSLISISHSLSESDARVLRKKLGPRFLEELFCLSREKDARVFFSGLFNWGMRLEEDERLEAAGVVYSMLVEDRSGGGAALIRHRARGRLDALQGRGAFGPRLEFLLNRFAEEATRPSTLIAMSAAGTAFRLGRFGTMGRLAGTSELFETGWALRVAGNGAGFLAETTAFTGMGKLAGAAFGEEQDWSLGALQREWAGGATMLLGLRIAGGLTNAGVRWAAAGAQGRVPFQRFTEIFAPQLGMFTGILLGNRLSEIAEFRPRQDGETWLVDGFSTLLQFNVAGHLTRGILGRGFERWERQMDIHAELAFRDWEGPWKDLAAWNWALSANPKASELGAIEGFKPSSEEKARGTEWLNSQMSTWGKAVSGTKEAKLRGRFAAEFPPPSSENFSAEIFEHALGTTCDLPFFHERLLEAYARAPNRGSREQYYTARAIEHLFHVDSLGSSVGSFHNSLLQFVIGRVLAENSPDLRLQGAHTVFQVMEKGLSRPNLYQLINLYSNSPELNTSTTAQYSHTFWQDHGKEAALAWQDFRDNDKVMLFNYIYQASLGDSRDASVMIQLFRKARVSGIYDPVHLEAALDLAQSHPLGKLVLQRLLHIFMIQDRPEKLKELAEPSWRPDLMAQFRHWRSQPEADPLWIAQKIRGTQYTAYLDDIHLARKIVSVLGDVDEYHAQPNLRYEATKKLQRAIERWIDTKKPLEAINLLNLLETNSSPQTKAIMFNWIYKDLEIEIVPPQQFKELFEKWGMVDTYNVGLFRQASRQGEKGRIYILDMPDIDTSKPEGALLAKTEIARRLIGLVHEWEHWRHSSGIYDGMKALGPPLSLKNMSPKERLVSEILSLFEEERMRNRNRDVDRWVVAARLGHNIITYLQDVAESAYAVKKRKEK